MRDVGTKGHCDHEECTLNFSKTRVSIGGGAPVSIYLRAAVEGAKILLVNDNSKFIQRKMQGKRRVY